MTSTIEWKFKAHSSLFEIFQALFPCDSIAGAPKEITTDILQSLEEGERGVYCSAVGVLEREKVVFLIPIRTIFRENGLDNFHLDDFSIKKPKVSQEGKF